MHKFRATYLGALILGWALSFGAYPSWGYYPPLQAVGSSSSNSVTYTVYNPQVQQGYFASHDYLGAVVNFQQHNGVIAWVVKDGTNYSVEWVTFDPALNTFQNGWQGPFPMVSHFQVRDGVVAFGFIDNSANAGCKFATYDPAKGAWQQEGFSEPGALTSGVLNKDGVVVYRYSDSSGGDNFKAKIYEPQWGKWSGTLYSGITSHYEFVFISNATIYYSSKAFGDEFFGYNAGGWGHITTVPMAYFVAQPDFGKKPLWVWFTDMSIAGANWIWDFKDSTSSTDRSPYHTFASTGIYQVSQQIDGPSTFSRTITVVTSFTLKNKSLPAILPLLLFPD